MRDSLTVLAILLICLLTAALVAPYFIDFNAHRALIEAKLSQAAGTRIAIAGPIKIRLLPQPIFRLGQVTVGDGSPGRPHLTVEHIDVDIDLTALMRGDLQVGETVLRSPRLELTAAADGTLDLRLPGLVDPSRVQLQHAAVIDGTLSVSQPGRPAFILSGLNFDAEAASLAGPFKLTGRFGPAEDRQDFRISTGIFEAGKLRLKFALDATKRFPSLDFDGTMTASGGTAQKSAGPRVEGLLAVKGQIGLADNPATVPWVLAGHIVGNRDTVTMADVGLRAGADLRALDATGTGEMVFGTDPHLRLQLHAPQLNLDSLAVAPDKSTVAEPKGLALLSALNGRFGQDGALSLPGTFAVGFGLDTVTTGPLTVLGVVGRVGLDDAKGASVSVTAHGPDAASVMLDGRFEGGIAPVFRGRLETSLRDLPRFTAWLAPILPDRTRRTLATLPAHAVSFAGAVDLSGVGIAARDAVLGLDQTALKGALTYTGAVGGDRARLFADLSSDALDLDALPNISVTGGGWNDLDLDLALAARAVKMVPAGVGAVDAGRLGLRLHKIGDRAVLDSASAELGNATLTATGALDGRKATLDAQLDAPALNAVADLLGRLMPGSATAWLRDRAEALSPARMHLGVRAVQAADGSILPTSFVLDATAHESRIKVNLAPDMPSDLDPQTTLVSIDLAADAPEALTLMRQLGVPALPSAAHLPTLGAGRIKGKAHGSVAEGFEASLDASLGGAVLSFQGRSKSDHGSGHLGLRASDLAPLLRSAGLVTGGQTGAAPWPADAEADLTWHDAGLAFRRFRGTIGPSGFSGDLDTVFAAPPPGAPEKPVLFGTLNVDRLSGPLLLDLAFGPAPSEGSEVWSGRPFGTPIPLWPSTEIAVKAKTLGLRDGLDILDASLTLRADHRAVTVADVTGKLRSGTVGGSLTLRRDGPSASMTGMASWSGLPIDWPGIAGRVGGSLDFGGSGVSPAALVANLAGAGSVTIKDGRIARFDPAALSRTATKAEKNTSEVDADQITADVVPELDRGPLPLGDVAGQATLATGVLRVGPLRAVTDDWAADETVGLDLRTRAFSSKTVLRVRQLLPDWRGEVPQLTMRLDGPIEAPSRDIDAAAFVNALQSRAIARDQERIDTLQQDIRERAFFNRRRKAVEADQAATREKAKIEAEAAAGTAEIQRQMQQGDAGTHPAVPLPLSRPRAAAPKLPRPPGGIPSSLPDPASAGQY